ncbi:uncharacterized protein N7459_001920 [Penicillium hispanicum]|uniref:uncharacterized protein n=1 Tax=Penicillium hispanicum TaxID=1080232 RepID=UPI002541F709|nr:uncharacterized protein N7459_001920 [Penicillium hispanicum]KAJ5591551.1 hypothetical protein N7459_001920 [Penicillium hispanicum]
MPSTRVEHSSLPHLSQILRLEPEDEPYCTAIAPSKGRRCKVGTNKNGRRRAMHLLEEGTEDLRAGRRIDDLLEDLAPQVLCTRYHQSHAASLVSRWKEQIRAAQRSHFRRVTSRRSSARIHPETPEDDLNEQISVLKQRLQELTERLQQRQDADQAPTGALNPPPPITPPRTVDGSPSSSSRSPINANSPRGINISTSSPSISTEPVRRQRVIIQPISRLQATDPGRQATRVALTQIPSPQSAASPRNTSRPEIVSRETESRPAPQSSRPVDRPRGPVRRPIEGDCGICLYSLIKTDTDGSDETSDTAEENGEAGDEELEWCKVQCGTNFHKSCINQWLDRSTNPTCPLCRRGWRH